MVTVFNFVHAFAIQTCNLVFTLYTIVLSTLSNQMYHFKLLEVVLEFIFVMLLHSRQVLMFTLQTVVWFTLSKQMLGFNILEFAQWATTEPYLD